MVLKTMSIFGGVQTMSILCGVIRTKLVALWLGASGLGVFAIFNSACDLITSITQLGMRNTSVRSIVAAHSVGNLAEIATVVRRWAWILGLLGAVTMISAAPLLSLKTFGSYAYSGHFIALSVLVFLQSLNSAEHALMQGTQHFRLLAKSSLWGISAGLLLSIPMFYFWRQQSIIPSIIVYTAATSVAILILHIRGLKPVKPVTAKETWDKGREFIILGIYMTGADFVSQLLSYVFIAFLNISGGDSDVGYYQAGYTLVNRYIGMVFSAIIMEYYPRLSAVAQSKRRASVFVSHETILITMVLMPLVLIFITSAPLLVRILYTSDFQRIVPYISIAMIGVIFRGLSWSMAVVILAKGDGKVFLTTESLSCVAGLVLNIVSFRLWGISGLGVSYTVWYIIYTVIVAVVYFRCYRLTMPAKVIYIPIATAAVTAAGAWLALTVSWIASLILAIPATAVSLTGLRRMLQK